MTGRPLRNRTRHLLFREHPGRNTLPALGVVLLSLGMPLEDFLVVIVGVLVGVAGVVLEIALGSLAIDALGELL